MSDDLASMLFELSSSNRLALIFLLKEKRLRLSQLSNLLKISATETARHLARLEEESLVEKDTSGQYKLSNLGKLVTQKLPSLELLSSRKRFFVSHELSFLTAELLSRVDTLHKTDFVEGVGVVTSLRETILTEAKKYVISLVDQMFPSLFPAFTDKLKEGIMFEVIVQADLLQGQKGCNNPNVREHLMNKVPLALLMNETEACINFPDKDGKVDYSEGFYGDSVEFVDWCNDIFRYYWEVSRTVTLET